MTLAADLANYQRIFLDTAPLIYYLEAHPQFGLLAKEVVNAVQSGTVAAYSSVITLAEVLPNPVEMGNTALVEQCIRLLKHSPNLLLMSISDEIAEQAGRLRGRYPTLRAMDAIQLAAALHIGADAFVTNDTRLRSVPDIRMMILKEYLP